MVLGVIFKQRNMKKYLAKLIKVDKRLAIEFPKEICEELDLKVGSKFYYNLSTDNKSFTLKKLN